MEIKTKTCNGEVFRLLTHDDLTVIIDSNRRINITQLIYDYELDPEPINKWLREHCDVCNEMINDGYMPPSIKGVPMMFKERDDGVYVSNVIAFTLTDLIDKTLSVKLMHMVFFIDNLYTQTMLMKQQKLKAEIDRLKQDVNQQHKVTETPKSVFADMHYGCNEVLYQGHWRKFDIDGDDVVVKMRQKDNETVKMTVDEVRGCKFRVK